MSVDRSPDRDDVESDADAPKLAAIVAVALGLPLLCGACFGATGLFALLGGGLLVGAGAWAWGGAGLALLVLVTGGAALFLRRRRTWRASQPLRAKN